MLEIISHRCQFPFGFEDIFPRTMIPTIFWDKICGFLLFKYIHTLNVVDFEKCVQRCLFCKFINFSLINAEQIKRKNEYFSFLVL